MNLAKFADIFKLKLSKGTFPYELFRDVKEMETTVTWPSYADFSSSLPSKTKNFLSEIEEILKLPIIYGFGCFGELLRFLEISLNLTEKEYMSELTPILSTETQQKLQKQLFMSPKLYFEQKFAFEEKIKCGIYRNFLDHLIYYNGINIFLEF